MPTYQETMLPLLRLAGSGDELRFRDAVERIADEFHLTGEERAKLIPSGRGPLIRNRVGWACTYLKQAGLLEATKRGYFRITDRGHKVLRQSPPCIDQAFLQQFPEFLEFRSRRKDSEPAQATAPPAAAEEDTPDEALAKAHARLQGDLQGELLSQVKACSPMFFEQLVVTLLVKMGYGGSRIDAGRAIGQSGDGGIDGIIKEDRLGLDAIYIQAKRWENTVGRPEVQKFAGALQGRRAKKGIMLTTSAFSREAHAYVANIDSRIVLIDGEALTQFMIDFGVGVSTVDTYEVKQIDTDFFEE